MSQAPPDSLSPFAELASFSAGLTLGALYIGALLSTFLAGITSVQTYIYYQHPISEKDSALFRGVIAFLWICDMLHAALFSHSVYLYGVTFYLDPLELEVPTWSLSADMIIGSVSVALMTGIMVTRIWRLSKRSWWIVAFIVMVIVLNTLALATSAAITVLSQLVSTFNEFHIKYAWLWYLCFGARAVMDFLIAIILGFLLSKYRSRVKRTNKVVNLLILYCVNTGAITSATSITVVITFATLPTSFTTFSSTVLLPKLMLNSLLSLLNSRQLLREKNKAEVVSIHLSNISSPNRGSSNRSPNATAERRLRAHRGYEDDAPGSGSLDSEAKPTSSDTVLVIA